MNIMELKKGSSVKTGNARPTDTELQREYNYILAEKLTKKLLEQGLISLGEFDKIMEKNRESFSPFFARI